jgi:hypothetical protein
LLDLAFVEFCLYVRKITYVFPLVPESAVNIKTMQNIISQ